MQTRLRNSLTTLVLLFLSISVFAQGQFVPGHIYTVTKDTIAGLIKLQDNADLANGCTFKKSQKGHSQKYNLAQLTGFQFDNEKRNFNKRTVEHLRYTQEVFLETVITGKLELYYWKDYRVGDVMYMSKQGDSLLIPFPFSQFDGNPGEYYMRIEKVVLTTEHQDTLRKYMEDRPDLYKDIKMIQRPKLDNLTRLIMKYDNIVDTTEIQNKTNSLSRPALFFITPGITNSDYNLLSRTSWDFYAGATFSLRLSGKYDQFTLNVGCYKRMVKGIPIYRDINSHYKIPIYLEYSFKGKWFRPFLGFGVDGFINDYSTRFLFAPAVGCSIKIIDRMAFSLRYASDLEIFENEGNRLMATYDSMTAGVQFKF